MTTGVEVITAALAAGATAGVSSTAGAAVQDLYTGLRDALRARLGGRDAAVRVLDAEPVDDPARWDARLGDDLVGSGADHDEELLAMARRLLAVADPDGTRAGKYAVTVADSQQVQVGDGTLSIGTSYGPAAATMSGPVSVSYTQPPGPPARPAAG